jgi:hypothetical protein
VNRRLVLTADRPATLVQQHHLLNVHEGEPSRAQPAVTSNPGLLT